MDEKNTQEQESVKFKPHSLFQKKNPEKVRGARMSKFNPELQTIIQHEAHKMRIFRIFMSLVILGAIALTAVGLFRYFQSQKARKQWIAGQFRILDKLEATFQDPKKKPYEKEQAAAKAFRYADMLATRAPETRSEVSRRNLEYERILQNSFPAVTSPGQKGMDFICRSGMLDMVHIPDGKFKLGRSNKSQEGLSKAEVPQREITIADQFWIARTEVTFWQIRKIIPTFQVAEWGEYTLDTPDQPACAVRWDQAMLYCKKLTELERNAGRIPAGYEYRLPTEAEWEYACRAGTDTVYPWGDSFGKTGGLYVNGLDVRSAKQFDWRLTALDDPAANDKYLVSAPVCSFKPNAWGLYDMLGNVAEWCYDWYSPYTYLDSKVTVSPVQNTPVTVVYTQLRPFDDGTWDTELPCKVIRGGSWGVVPRKLRPAHRDFMPPNEKNNGVGFRPVLAPIIRNRIRN